MNGNAFTIDLTPDAVAGYHPFRARLRQLSSDARTLYSPAHPISVSP